MLVMLKRSWPGHFRRVLRDEAGQPLVDEAGVDRVLAFTPGEAVELTDEEYAHVAGDVQVDEKRPLPLVHVRLDAKQRVRLVELDRDGDAEHPDAEGANESGSGDPLEDARPKRKKK